MASAKRTYKVLKQQIFQSGDYKIVPIRDIDKYDIMQWRNEQMYHLRQNEALTRKQQDAYFDKIISKLFEQDFPEQILFSYLQNDNCIGYGGLVHIDWEKKSAELSFIMATDLEAEQFAKHWTNFIRLIEKVAFQALQFHKIFTYAYDLRPHLYPVLEQNGFQKTKILSGEISIDSKAIDVIIHEKVNPTELIYFRTAVKSDEKLLFDWANDPVVRKQSFHSKPIDYQTHKKWFQAVLADNKRYLWIAEFNQNPVAQIRFDVVEEYAVISISIDEKHRGKGLGSIILQKATKKFVNKKQLSVVAYIKKENTASIKSFEKAGYRFVKEEEVDGIERVVYKSDE